MESKDAKVESGVPEKNSNEIKEKLVNIILKSLIQEPRFYFKGDLRVKEIFDCCETVVKIDDEFILQVAFYSFIELNLHSTANYLLAYAASKIKGKSELLKKYIPHCISSPADLLEVVSFTQLLVGVDPKKIVLSSTIKKICQKIFARFSPYELAKYCSDNKRKHEMIKKKKLKSEGNDQNIEKISMKRLIRLCHIKEPMYEVLCILGKPYQVKEDFNKNFPGKEYDETKVGKRMKLPVPTTWETLLSQKGNIAEVWIELIQSNSLAYPIVLKNVRNFITTWIPTNLHEQVCKKIRDKFLVISSKTFPFRYIQAIEGIKASLRNLEEQIHILLEEKKEKKRSQSVNYTKRDKSMCIPNTIPSIDTLNLYNTSLEEALNISIESNIKPIQGSTVLFTDMSDSMDRLAYGQSNFPCKDIGIFIGLMLKVACRAAQFNIFASPGAEKLGYLPIHTAFNKETPLIEAIKSIKRLRWKLGTCAKFPFNFMEKVIESKEKIDNLILISDMVFNLERKQEEGKKKSILEVLNEYREKVNPKMRYYCIDLLTKQSELNPREDKSPLNIVIYGYNDSILRFVSENEELHVDSIKKIIEKMEFK